MKLDGEMKKEEEEAIIKVKGEALIEKEDPGAFVIPIRLEAKIDLNALANTSSDINVMPFHIYKELGRKEVKPVNRGITMSNHSKAEPIGYTPIIVGRGFLYTCGSILNIIERITSTFDGICHQMFHAAKIILNTKESDNDDEEDYGINLESRNPGPKPAQLWEHMTMRPDPHDPNAPGIRDTGGNWNVLNQMGCGEAIDEMLTIKLCVAGTDEEIFTLEARTRAFNIKEPIYSELCHEFYSTYEFDDVCADDELRTKKIIKFRLCGRAFSWTLLEFAKRLELYHSEEIKEEGFDVYFQGGLRSDEHFNAREALDTTTLRELMDSEGRLILEVLEPGVPRVAIPRALRASMQDLYE
ncbi:hypothetical protein Tco_0761700 [Tanacetum coccineum]